MTAGALHSSSFGIQVEEFIAVEIVWGQAISGGIDCNVPFLADMDFWMISLSFRTLVG